MNIIKEYISANIKIKRSEFIAHLFKAETAEEAKQYVAQINKEHRNAAHNCWGYILGEKGETFHSSDNGEPSGTAGKPIVRTLQKHDLTYVTAIITRYYGGVKLGVRGLIEAYSEAVEEAIAKAELQELVTMHNYFIEVDYKNFETIKHHLTKQGAEFHNTDYQNNVTIDVKVKESLNSIILQLLESYQSSGKISFIPGEVEERAQ